MAKSSGGNGGPGTAMAPAAKARDQALAIKSMLEASGERLAAVLPRHMTAAKQIQIVATMVYKTPDLQKCAPATILAAVLEASELGLSLSRSAGEAWLVPFWNGKANIHECQFQPGYRGLVKLAYQGGFVALIEGRLVHEADDFSYGYDPDLVFRHVPHLGDDRGKVTHAYAFVKLRTGERSIEVMTTAEIEKVRKRSKAGQSGPWVTDWEEMAKKTPLRRKCKTIPRSEELTRAIAADEREYEDGPRSVLSGPPVRGLSKADRMAAELEGPAIEPEFVEGTEGKIRSEDDGEGRGCFPDEALESTEAGARG